MKLLDLYCGAGGASLGLSRAGFDVTGVDITPQPNYPFPFILANALDCNLNGYDAYWASPPCQAYTTRGKAWGYDYPKLIEPTRERLRSSGKPYIIENVIGAPLINWVMLCGTMFNLGVFRHRYFESNVLLLVPPHAKHDGELGDGKYVTVAGHASIKRDYENYLKWPKAMDIYHMSKGEIREAIPPAYSEFLGRQLIKYLT
jgi:DNA (cytosine-5)-methyltransferase 1